MGLISFPEPLNLKYPFQESPDLNLILSPGANVILFIFPKFLNALDSDLPSFVSSPKEKLI